MRRGLRRQFELEFVEQQLEFGLRVSVAREDQFAPVGSGQVHIDQLQRGNFSNTLRVVSPGASVRSRCVSVTCKQ